MSDDKRFPDAVTPAPGVNPGYAAFQIAKALTTSREHDDPATRERASAKIHKWETVLHNIITGAVDYGSRTALAGVPVWATLEVVTGGFATGELLAAGALQEHERHLLQQLSDVAVGNERCALNGHFLTDDGVADLQSRLRNRCYDVSVPEEGALLVIAWLVENGLTDEARSLLDEISPWLATLRFYPVPVEKPKQFGAQVHLQNVQGTIRDIQRIKPNSHLLAQKEAVEIWAPFYDRLMGLFLETFDGDSACRRYPDGWSQRALALLGEYAELRKEHKLCGKPEKADGHFAQLRRFLAKAARLPDLVTNRDADQIRLIASRYIAKRGLPNSEACASARNRQRADVAGPTFHEVGKVVLSRLERHPQSDGLDDVNHLTWPVNSEESQRFRLSAGSAVPESIRQKVERCLNETVSELVERGLITSGETLARVLPQMTSGLRAAGISDPSLRHLYAAIYRAFRRRRSLLLLNLEKQVQIEELPWVAAIDRFRSENLSSRELARQALEEITRLTIASFPYAILPNKLLQELRALAASADLDIPLVDEVAADIFMGQFSGKFMEAAMRAGELLEGSLYAKYYGIDYGQVRNIAAPEGQRGRRWFRQKRAPNGFAELCAARAGVPLGTWDPATNGMIIEQQQIITTQNLAVLFAALDLTETLRRVLGELATQCFQWICNRQQMKIDNWHARLIMVKNTAYAWRQMVFFISLLSKQEVAEFLRQASQQLEAQTGEFANRFRPVLDRLISAAEGECADNVSAQRPVGRCFLGWSKTQHWLLDQGCR